MTFKKVFEDIEKALITSGAILIIIGCAGVLNWLIATQQIPAMISAFIAENVTTRTMFLLLVGLVFFTVGFFMDLIALIVILGPILQPALRIYGIDPIHFGIIAIMYVQISFLTPPFGLNLFVTMGMRKRTLMEVSKSTAPFVIILLLLTLLLSFVPEISLFLPNLVMG
jgi:C4-dicarboxylate transporter DctM subunit